MKFYTPLCVILAVGCQIQTGAEGTTFRCSDGFCPPGLTCESGLCVSPGSPDAASPGVDGAVGGDDGSGSNESPDASIAPPDAAPPDADCGGTIVLFADDFDDGVLDPFWDASFQDLPEATTAEAGGRLSVALMSGFTGTSYAGYASSQSIDLRGEALTVEVVQSINVATQAQSFLIAWADGQNALYILHEGTTIYFIKREAGTDQTVAADTYNATDHRWWRIREDAGRVYWETSANGVDWFSHGDRTAPPFVDALSVELSGGMWQSETNPGTIQFDNFTAGGSSPLCKRSPGDR